MATKTKSQPKNTSNHPEEIDLVTKSTGTKPVRFSKERDCKSDSSCAMYRSGKDNLVMVKKLEDGTYKVVG
jgi:hypothetical protein